jgi:hypothetical protein
MLTPPANPPVATGLTFSANTVSVGSSFTATFVGSSLAANTFFDVRFRTPGSTVDGVVVNWQQGTSKSITVPAGTQTGIWTITGVRAHASSNDGAGPFTLVSVTLTVQ